MKTGKMEIYEQNKDNITGSYGCCYGVESIVLCTRMRREKMPRQSIELPKTIKEGLDKMALTFGMSQNALINLAVTTMVVKYDAEGTRIFFDLISPPTKRK